MTLANKLTMARLALALLTFACLWTQRPGLYPWALALYAVATVTDWVDGFVARRTGSVSAFGALADPVADKILVIGALIAFIRIPDIEVPNWAVFLIVVRELVVGMLRALFAVTGKVHSAGKAWKWSMAVQSACVLAMLAALCFPFSGPWASGLPFALTLVCLAASWSSGGLYLYQARAQLRKSWSPGQGLP